MKENVLFIDDDENLLKSYVRQFRENYNVQTASCGEEAIRILKEGKKIPIIVSDYSMPQMNGIEVFQTINKISPETIKILVTGYADINIALDAINKGHIFRFITKPFDINVLHSAIDDAIFQHKLLSIEKTDILKTEFLNIISHEIRTPLTGISAFLEIIKSEMEAKTLEKLSPYFDKIGENSNRLLRTIQLMIDISEVMSKTVNIIFEPIKLVEEILKPSLLKNNKLATLQNTLIDLNMEIDESIIIYDKYCLEQIFSNIIHNALIFTTNGIVSITVVKSDKITIEISDNGVGMSKEFQEKMFEPFLQEDTGTTRKYDGNGLGLTLVKEYCTLLDIKLEVKSEKNVGSTFRLTLKSED